MAPDEFPNLLETCIPHLRAYARSLTRLPDSADDLVQDTLLRAWSARPQFQPGTNFMAWVFTILRNRFLDQRRRDHYSAVAIDGLAHINLISAPSQDVVIHFDEMAHAFWRLSPHHREVLMLVGALGLDYADAAKVIGCAVGTIRSRLSRARAELHSLVDREGSGAKRRKRAVARQTSPGTAEFLRALEAAA